VSNKLFIGTTLMLVMFIFSQAAFTGNTFLVSASEPSNLIIFVGPPSVLADNNVYGAIFVQLQDSTGLPARARQDTMIQLSSSLTNIGSVDPVMTIPAGYTYAVAKFNSTYTPGTTTITAAAPGYMTVQTSITTVGPVPSKLAVYSFPPSLPADSGSYPAIIVQLQDLSGFPARAPIGNATVTLSSSNITVGTVDPFVVIKAGSTYAVATFSTTHTEGSADITALASGYSSGQTTITTQQTVVQQQGEQGTLKVYVGPPNVPADGISYEQVAVQLQNSSGKIIRAPGDITVALSSSDTAVGTIEPTITIGATQTYALASFNSTYRSGTTTITAAAANYESSQESLTTVGPIPLKLGLYCVPLSLPADDQSYGAILVQLQDSAGNPARDPSGNVSVHLLSSMPEAGNVSSPLTIPYGKTYSTANFSSTYTANFITITALTSGYETAQANVTTYVIDQPTLTVSVTAQPETLNSSEQAVLRVYVAYNGLSPASGATIWFTSDNSGSFSTATDEGNGYYTSNFTAPIVTGQTVCTILANAYKPLYTSGQANVKVTVNPIILNVSVTAQPQAINSSQQTTITVYVKSSELNPIPGATVTLASNNGGNFSDTTDEGNGYYTSNFTAPIVTGQTVCTILATAYKTGYNSGQANTQLTINSTITTGTIQLHVTETDGNPINEANVTTTSHPPGISALTGTTDEAGHIAFNDVPEGSYTIQISKTGYDTKNETISVTASQTTDHTTNLSKTPSLLPPLPILIAIIAAVIIAIIIIAIVIRKFRISLSKSPDSNSETDHATHALNNDNRIDIKDIAPAAKHFGQSNP
jgi:hypothetical protein